MKLQLLVNTQTINSINLDSLQKIKQKRDVLHFIMQIDWESIIFHFDSDGRIYDCIKQLEPIQQDIIQLCKDLYNIEKSNIDWEEHILPLIRQNKIKNLLQ